MTLDPLGVQPTGGAEPCHLAVTPDGGHLFVANYGSGSIAVFPLDAAGAPGERSDLVTPRGARAGPGAPGAGAQPHGLARTRAPGRCSPWIWAPTRSTGTTSTRPPVGWCPERPRLRRRPGRGPGTWPGTRTGAVAIWSASWTGRSPRTTSPPTARCTSGCGWRQRTRRARAALRGRGRAGRPFPLRRQPGRRHDGRLLGGWRVAAAGGRGRHGWGVAPALRADRGAPLRRRRAGGHDQGLRVDPDTGVPAAVGEPVPVPSPTCVLPVVGRSPRRYQLTVRSGLLPAGTD